MTVVLWDGTTEYATVKVEHSVGGEPADPRAGYTPWFAFTVPTERPTPPAPGSMGADWSQGTWEANAAGDEFFAICLVGPGNGGVDLDVGDHAVWLFLDGVTEEPLRYAGKLRIK